MEKLEATRDKNIVENYVKEWKTPLVALKNIYNSIGLSGVALSFPAVLKYQGADLKLAALAELCFVGSAMLSGATMMGFETVKYYDKTFDYFKKNGKIDDIYLRFFLANKKHAGADLKTLYKNTEGTWYCQRRGVELAMKELGLEKQWEEACQKYGVKPEHDKRLFLT